MFDHLKETKLSYCLHMKQALGYYGRIQIAAAKVFVHAFCPSMFINDASDEICRLHEEMHGDTKKTNI